MKEFEKKVLLSKNEFDYLREHVFVNAKTETHINHYYDTDELTLNAVGITCRIRESGKSYSVTVKSHQKDQPDYSVEYSCPITEAKETFNLEGMHLRRQGHLTTERSTLTIDDGLIACLDKNTYLGISDYELEIEYPENESQAAQDTLRILSEQLGSIGGEHTLEMREGKGKSKSERFFAYKNATAHISGTE